MLPSIISQKLSTLRRWELCLRLLWGAARWGAVVLVLLAFACMTDWAIDRYYDTPYPLRFGLFVGQIAVGLVLVYLWLFRPATSKLSPSDMALLVEEKTPVFQHRLISVVQFHQPGAQTGGMSRELIVRVTEETVEQSSQVRFTAALDKRRIGWSLSTFLPVLVILAIPLMLWPELIGILLQRQLLANVPIPRSVYIESDNPTVWPKGEDIVLRFRVSGEALKGWEEMETFPVGMVRVDPEGQPSMYFDLVYESTDEETGEAIFVTPPPEQRQTHKLPTITHFHYRAWLADGRTPRAEQLSFEPRPVIDSQSINAWVLLPSYTPARPDGNPYELKQLRGEIVALEGSSARVNIKIQKPVKKATLHLLGPVGVGSNPTLVTSFVHLNSVPSTGGPLTSAAIMTAFSADKNLQQQLVGPEIVLKEIPMTLLGKGEEAEGVFPLPETASGYRLVVEDEYGFKNIPAPRRSIRIVPEEIPQVAMLPVVFDAGVSVGLAEDFPMDGMPIPPNGKFRVVYTASAPFGMGGARMHYRVIKVKTDPKEGSIDYQPTPWIELPLTAITGTKEAGPFLPHRGIFMNSKDDEQIQFHAVPARNLKYELGGKIGGGRFDFYTKSMLLDNDGKAIPLQPGDQIEYKIEVFPAFHEKITPAEIRDLYAFRKSGFSETRTVTVVTIPEYLARLAQYDQEKARIRKLRESQGKVFPSGE